MGWGIFLLGSLSLLVVTNSIFQLRLILSVTPWLAGFGMLLVMVWPYHTNGISRSLLMSAYACIASPPIWWALKGIYFSQDHSLDREPRMAWTTLKAESTPELSKLCWGILLSDIQPATFRPWSNCLFRSYFLSNDLHIPQDVQIVWGDWRQGSDKGNWTVVIVVFGSNNYIKKSCCPPRWTTEGAEKLFFQCARNWRKCIY